MSSPTPWEACGNVIRDADSIEVCTVALWCKQPSEVAERIVRAVNAHEALVEHLERMVDVCYLCNVGVLERQEAEAAIAKAGQQ